MRKLILNLHLYTALVAGLFVIILGITGSILAFEDDLDRISNQKLLYSEPKGKMISAVSALDRLHGAYPGQRIAVLRLPSRRDGVFIAAVRGVQVYLDAYSGEIHGTRSGVSLLQSIHNMHLRLMMGKPAGTFVGVVGIVIIFLVLSGIYLWWPLKRSTVKFGAPARRASFDIHNTVGIYSAAFLLILAITGTAVAFDDTVFPWVYKVTNSTPPKRSAPSTVQPGAPAITPDEALRAASDALPGAAPIAVLLPPNPKGSFVIAMHFPEDLTPGGRSWVIIDQYSGKALSVESSRNPPAGTRVEIVNRAIHTGDIFGYPSKILMSLASLMLVVQVITGYWMWWKKLRSGRETPQKAPAVAR